MALGVEPDRLEPLPDVRLLGQERVATPPGLGERGCGFLGALLLGDEVAADGLEIATSGGHALRRRERLGEARQGRFGLLASETRLGQLRPRGLERRRATRP